MARRPQRSERWSLRQVSLEAGVTLATARAVVRSGHLDAGALTEADVLVLKVAAMLPALQPLGEMRPANAARAIPKRELQAVALVRAIPAPVSDIATLVITQDGAILARTYTEVSNATLEATGGGLPYLAIPVGKWIQQLRRSVGEVAA